MKVKKAVWDRRRKEVRKRTRMHIVRVRRKMTRTVAWEWRAMTPVLFSIFLSKLDSVECCRSVTGDVVSVICVVDGNK